MERGILTRIKDGHRVYLLSNEVKELRRKRQIESGQKKGQIVKSTITIPIETYGNLLTELAETKSRTNYLIEYKKINENLIRELVGIKEIIQENKEKEKEISHLEEQSQYLKSSSIFTIQKKDDEIKELRRNLTELQRKLTREKKKGFFKRIFNK